MTEDYCKRVITTLSFQDQLTNRLLDPIADDISADGRVVLPGLGPHSISSAYGI
jgi:hypothetical protein